MKVEYNTPKSFYRLIKQTAEYSNNKEIIITLSKVDCYLMCKYIATNFDDGICEELTWDNDLIFNCETYTHQEMYDKLFKLKFRGVQLGQE